MYHETKGYKLVTMWADHNTLIPASSTQPIYWVLLQNKDGQLEKRPLQYGEQTHLMQELHVAEVARSALMWREACIAIDYQMREQDKEGGEG